MVPHSLWGTKESMYKTCHIIYVVATTLEAQQPNTQETLTMGYQT